MRVLKLLLVLLFLVVSGCAGTAPQKMTFNGCNIEVGYKEAVSDGYYLVLEKNNQSWELIEYSESRIKEKEVQPGPNFVNHELTYAQPFFEKVEYFNGNTFECTPLIDDKNSYTPCTSNFMGINVGMSFGKNLVAAATTVGLAAGTHKEIDREEIAKAIVQSGLLDVLKKVNIEKEKQFALAQKRFERQQALARERAAKCAKERDLLASFANLLKVDIKIINQSGYSYPEGLVGFKKEMIIDNVPGSLKNSSVKITAFSNSDDYVIDFDKKELDIAYGNDKKITIRSYLRSKRFNGLFPGSNYSNNEIKVYLKSIEKTTNGSISVKVNIANKTKKYVNLESISFYLNNKIYTLNDQNLELAPLAIREDAVFSLPKNSKWYSSWSSSLEGFINSKEANSKLVSIDLSAKYSISNMVKTLFQEKQFYYKDLVNL